MGIRVSLDIPLLHTGHSMVSLGWFIHWYMQIQQYRCPHEETTGSFARSRHILHSNFDPLALSGAFFCDYYLGAAAAEPSWLFFSSSASCCFDLSSISRSLLLYLQSPYLLKSSKCAFLREFSEGSLDAPRVSPFVADSSLPTTRAYSPWLFICIYIIYSVFRTTCIWKSLF